jgi:rod shape-determining protein MreC
MLDVHEQPVQVGDAVLTSGEMGVFPRGLLIGSVLHVSQTPGSLTHSIDVRPAAALATVHDVLIVLPRRSDALDLIREQGR